MNLKRTAIVFVGCAALAAWLSAAMTPAGPVPVVATAPEAHAVDVSAAALAQEITRLHERLRPESVLQEPTRNPFAFRAGRREAPASADAPRAVPAAAAPAIPPAPALTLIGVAEDQLADGDAGAATTRTVRTAIISGRGQLFLVKEGDTVTDGALPYTIGPVSASAVDLVDPRDGRLHRLTLK